MFDDPDALTSSDRGHYHDCADCQARFTGMADDARAATTMLATPELKVDVASAFKRVQAAPAAKPRFGFSLPIMRPASRPMFVGLAAAVVLAALVVTAFANILPLFQPTTVQAIPVSVADIQSLSALSEYGTVTWSQQPTPQVVLSAADAEKIAGFNAPVAHNLPAAITSSITYAAMPAAVAVFTFDAAKAQAAVAKTGKSLPKLPSGMDGAQLTVTVGPALVEVYGNLNQSSASSQDINLPQLVIAESAAPTVTSTQVTTAQLIDYVLSMPGISKDLAAAIRAVEHPASTLLIPVPIQYATSSTVTVQNHFQGVAVGDNTGLGYGVIWINGHVFAVAGPQKQSVVLQIADDLT
jgi:hypothetical protein